MATHDEATRVDEVQADESGCTVDWSWLNGLEVESVKGAGVAVPLAQPVDDEAGSGHRAVLGHLRRLWVKRSSTTAAMVTAPETKLLR